jgi:glucokinase
MGEYVLAADLGGTNLRMAVVGPSGAILHRERCPTPHDKGSDGIVSAIVELARKCTSVVDEASIDVLGAAIPATIDFAHGIVHYAPNLQMLNGVHFSAQLAESLGVEIVLENDATAAAIGEHQFGASREFKNSVCVTLGTGVGSGIILNGEPLRGPDGTAGEFGHVCVEPDGRPCGCGSWGCLEQYASATAVVRMTAEMSVETPSVLSGRTDLTSEEIYKAAKAGDEVAIDTFRKMGYYLGIAFAGLANLLNPEAIVLAGGLAAGWDMFIDEVRDQIMKRAFREPALRVKLVRAELGDDAGILGVASLALARSYQGI